MRHLIVAVLLFAFSPVARAEDSAVIASIKPLHSLVASVMGETGAPVLLVGGAQSPHDYELRPSQKNAINHARILFYIGGGFERFLNAPLADAPGSLQKVAMMEQIGMTLLKPRTGSVWEPHEHHAGERQEARHLDAHLWLDTGNAKIMVNVIRQRLSALYPQNMEVYARNAAATIEKLDALDGALQSELLPLQHKPFIVFHDAFQYFERDYGLSGAGSITLEPEQTPSLQRIREVRAKLRTLHSACVFTEPQFNARLADTVTEGVSARIGVLDEHGAALEPGPTLYFQLMRQIAADFRNCLKD